jgi:hypothetical protein
MASEHVWHKRVALDSAGSGGGCGSRCVCDAAATSEGADYRQMRVGTPLCIVRRRYRSSVLSATCNKFTIAVAGISGNPTLQSGVMEVDNTPLWSTETKETSVEIPRLCVLNASGKPILWLVTAVDAQGRS